MEKALATPGPVLIEAIVDPLEPPMPAKATMKQTVRMAESLARGEPHRGKIALSIMSDKIRELI
jgi:pyruvate dehydrogenase (quinone)/pyruvate oxidase